ncbi:hypothetical protein BN8_03636 [Fibrisoma limi BUZ 3]|uniref:Uncharacterized protein n=1 Tax=Fibrisoma limi BUZ 3 TaxID=1185876 RepID=I2GKN8_9BACT|nr:hypothetical protein [Fibrisoma limi]CCH54464.1 hypothetical protein BN8_03636 [Fibrisoma limi BUZ 3]
MTSAAPTSTFLDSFYGLDAHILRKNDLGSLADLYRFRHFAACQQDDLNPVSKLLLNGWSAEYALRITPIVNDEQYLQSSLHWTFPQAYYSIHFTARAFLAVQGLWLSNEELIGKRLANYVVNGFYPESLGFYAYGFGDTYRVCRLSDSADEKQVADLLHSTRTRQFKRAKEALQANPKTALRRPATGEILTRFSANQYKELSRHIGYTTYYDVMKRLRISSVNRDLERTFGATDEVDVRSFHASLVRIVSHINSVHEAYICKSVGYLNYCQIVNNLPFYLRENFVGERLHSNKINPM